MYGIKATSIKWFEHYPTNRMQIKIDKDGTHFLSTFKMCCTQNSILERLLFLIYVNDLPSASSSLDLLILTDDANLFSSHKDIKVLFKTVNKELRKGNKLYMLNKLSLNTEKTFHKNTSSRTVTFQKHFDYFLH